MPAATSKAEWLTAYDTEFAKLSTLIANFNAVSGEWATKDDDTRVKDILIHRAHWIDLFFVWVEGGQNGEDVQTPAPGYKWNQLKSYNAMVRETHAAIGWDEACANLEKKAHALRTFIATSDDVWLYTKHLYPWMNNWTLGRWAEAAGPSAFRSAIQYIRKVRRENA